VWIVHTNFLLGVGFEFLLFLLPSFSSNLSFLSFPQHRVLHLNLLLHPKKKNHHNLRRKGPLSPRRKRFLNPRRKRLRNLKRKRLLNQIIRKYLRKQFLALEKWK